MQLFSLTLTPTPTPTPTPTATHPYHPTQPHTPTHNEQTKTKNKCLKIIIQPSHYSQLSLFCIFICKTKQNKNKQTNIHINT